MATYYSQDSGAWSTLTNWDTNPGGGGSDPASVAAMDNQTFIIQAGHNIEFDVDMSGFSNGIAGLTITGGATPGMLYSKYSGAGTYYLMIKAGTHLQGTLDTNRGRLLANSDGVWGHTTALPYDRKFQIMFRGGTSYFYPQNVDVALYCTEPGIPYVETYGSLKEVDSIDTDTDVITMKAAHGWSNDTPVMVRSSGSLPSPLQAGHIYYVEAASGATLKLIYTWGGGTDQVVNLTSAGTGTIEIYDGHSSTSTAVMNVLTDVTADPQWVASAPVALCDTYSRDIDIQRLTFSSATSSTITLSANVDSVQYPGARIYLGTRNVEILTDSTSTSANVIYYTGTPVYNSGSVYNCAFRATAATGTTVYTRFFNYGAEYYPATIAGVVHGVNSLLWAVNGLTFSGYVLGGPAYYHYGPTTYSGVFEGLTVTQGGPCICSGSFYSGTSISAIGATLSGTFIGCGSTFNQCQNCVISGTIRGCSMALTDCIDCKMTASAIIEESGTAASGYAAISRGTRNIIDGILRNNWADFDYGNTGASNRPADNQVLGSCTIVTPPKTRSRNLGGSDTFTYQTGYNRYRFSDYAGSLGAHYTAANYGDIIRNTSVLRSGGATSSMEVVPLSYCGPINIIPIFEWTELAVPEDGELTKTIYVKGVNWGSGYPLNTELYFEAEYFNHASNLTTAVIASTDVLTDENWTAFTVTFTPLQVGPVRYRGYLKTYDAGGTAKIYIDAKLYGGAADIPCHWVDGTTVLMPSGAGGAGGAINLDKMGAM
jgi:hypothetical protein